MTGEIYVWDCFLIFLCLRVFFWKVLHEMKEIQSKEAQSKRQVNDEDKESKKTTDIQIEKSDKIAFHSSILISIRYPPLPVSDICLHSQLLMGKKTLNRARVHFKRLAPAKDRGKDSPPLFLGWSSGAVNDKTQGCCWLFLLLLLY